MQITREVEEALGNLRQRLEGRERLLAVHGNRFIIHVVMQRLKDPFVRKQNTMDKAEKDRVRSLTEKAFKAVYEVLEKKYPDAYLASLFKNQEKCKDVKGSLAKF